MTFLLDNGLPRSAVFELAAIHISAIHVGEIGMSGATDLAIIRHAVSNHLTIVTLDADFHTLLALAGASAPSVIRFRVEGLRAARLAAFLAGIAKRFAIELDHGAMLSVGAKTVRCRLLPLQ